MSDLRVQVMRVDRHDDLALPAYETAQSAGLDLAAAVAAPLEIAAGERALVATGLAIALPAGFEAQIRPRSGLAAKFGITVLNSPGTIDADYRGEIGVIMINHGKETFVVKRGMRIAQMLVTPVTRFNWSEKGDLSATERGSFGFGSTGIKT